MGLQSRIHDYLGAPDMGLRTLEYGAKLGAFVFMGVAAYSQISLEGPAPHDQVNEAVYACARTLSNQPEEMIAPEVSPSCAMYSEELGYNPNAKFELVTLPARNTFMAEFSVGSEYDKAQTEGDELQRNTAFLLAASLYGTYKFTRSLRIVDAQQRKKDAEMKRAAIRESHDIQVDELMQQVDEWNRKAGEQ